MRRKLLSAKEIKALGEYNSKVVRNCTSTERCDREKAELAARNFYSFFGMLPEETLWVESPLQLWGYDDERDWHIIQNVWEKIADVFDSQLGEEFKEDFEKRICSLPSQSEKLYEEEVAERLGTTPHSSGIWEKQYWHYLPFLANLQYMDISDELKAIFDAWTIYDGHVFDAWVCEDKIVFCDRPTELHFTHKVILAESERLEVGLFPHFDGEPAVLFSDGFSVNVKDGRRVAKEPSKFMRVYEALGGMSREELETLGLSVDD